MNVFPATAPEQRSRRADAIIRLQIALHIFFIKQLAMLSSKSSFSETMAVPCDPDNILQVVFSEIAPTLEL